LDGLLQDIQTFLDEATEGAIYFSFGSMIRSDTFPSEILEAFIEAFTQLSLRVLWKRNANNLPAHPGNVLTRQWMPQQDILGNQSFMEAVYMVTCIFTLY
jgi:glucuronosyltransferase